MNYRRQTIANIYAEYSDVEKFRPAFESHSIPAEFPRVEVVGEIVVWSAYKRTGFAHVRDDAGGLIQIHFHRDKFETHPEFRGGWELGTVCQVQGAVYRVDFRGGDGPITILVESILKCEEAAL